jgi:hypothetical protein
VFIDDRIDRNGRVYFRCHVDETLHQPALEIPDWMFETTCSAIRVVEVPVVNCDALRNLKTLLANTSSHDPSLKEAQCFEGGADAKDTGFKTVTTRTISSTNADAQVECDATGGTAEDDRAHVAIAPATLGKAERVSGQGGRS